MFVIDMIRRLRRKRQKGADMEKEVARLERKQGEKYIKEKQDNNNEKQRLEAEAKANRINEMKNKKRVRIGKQPMFRSVKRSKKKVEQKKEIDPEKLAFLKYLGQFDEEEPLP